jgi:pimeloyl-[acyl-carrier protein] synthase
VKAPLQSPELHGVHGAIDKRLSLLRILAPENLSDPHCLYRGLREYDPVHWDPYLHAWVVTTYAEAVEVLMHFSADRTPQRSYLEQKALSSLLPFAEMMSDQMMFMDGARHATLRSLCSAVFTPRKVQELRSEIEAIANGLIDPFIESGQIDMVADFASPLPAIITAKLLGVPPEDHAQLHAWVLDLAELLGNYQQHPDRIPTIVRSLQELRSYLCQQMKILETRPRDGLLYSLMTVDVDGQKLSSEEVLANTIITLIGGHETTTNLIASGFLTLLQNPDAFAQLQRDPGIVASAVEELLRFESPVQHTARIALTDVELGGKLIRRGSKVVAVLAAANRDPVRFPDPDRLNLLREDNRHLAFGWAAHFCFGAPLARLEGQIAFNVLLRRLSNSSLGSQRLEWRQNAGLRGLVALPVRFEARSFAR